MVLRSNTSRSLLASVITSRTFATDAEIADFFRHVVERKPKEHDFRDGYIPQRHMTAIGG